MARSPTGRPRARPPKPPNKKKTVPRGYALPRDVAAEIDALQAELEAKRVLEKIPTGPVTSAQVLVMLLREALEARRHRRGDGA